MHAGTLITAIPALLGFVPESSLIVLAYRGDNTIIATMRYDLLLRADGRPSRVTVHDRRDRESMPRIRCRGDRGGDRR